MISDNLVFLNSTQYWNDRYSRNLTSGAGSYGKLAEFKADFINSFIAENNIQSVIEFGCGDGNQLKLASYPNYLGFDVSDISIQRCEELFYFDKSKRFLLLARYSEHSAELSLSLDVIYHLVEDQVFEQHIDLLFGSSSKFVIIYSSNNPDIIDNKAKHVRHRCFTEDVENKYGNQWALTGVILNKFPFDGKDYQNTSFSDFYIYEKKITD